MDVAGPIHAPLSDDSQSPSSSAPLSPLLPPDGHPNGHPDEYSDSDMDYLDDELDSDAIEALQPSSDEPSPTRGRYNMSSRERQSTQFKLQQVANTLRRVQWSFRTFILAWAGAEKGKAVTIQHLQYAQPQQRQRVLMRAMDDPRIRGICQRPSPADSFAAELDNLIRQPYFGQFDHTTDLETLDFELAFKIIQEVAPTWHAILLKLISNQRAHRASYDATPQSDALSRRLFAITSIVCHSRAKKRSSFLSSILDVYLIGSGVKRRVIETLSGLGICHGYHQANRLMAKVAEEAEVQYPTPVNSCKLL